MVKAELIKRSPLRILEKSIHGGLKSGHLGVIASHRGVGKTACLVHLATDKLLQGKHVIHVSFSSKTDHIIDWYETVFKEISKQRDLESAVEIHDEIIKNRVILNFNQDSVSVEQIVKSIETLIADGGFAADILVIDGFDFESANGAMIGELRTAAAAHGFALWATADIEVIGSSFPKELAAYEKDISVLIDLEPSNGHIQLSLRKDYDKSVNEDLHLMLEARTLLIVEE